MTPCEGRREKRSAYCVVRSSEDSPRTTHYALRNSYLLTGLIFLLLAISACGATEGGEPQPPTIHHGEDICEFCGMIVTEERYASGYITGGGEELIFDDVGDMVQYYLDNQDEVAAFFVHHHETRDWIRAETAYFALSPNLPTPMLSGLAAFPSTEEAEEFAAGLEGEVFTFDELLTHYRENPPTPFLSDMATD